MVSVIVPVYNVKKYLPKCVDSLLNQTLQDIEIILVDDGSTDGSGEICDQYAEEDERVKVYHQPNTGQGAARNLGLDNANGSWIGFVDADDWVDKEYYEKLLQKVIVAYADMACCNRRVYDEKGNIIYEAKVIEKVTYEIMDVEEYFYSYFFKYTLSCCNKIYKKSCLKGIRFHSVKEVGSEDALFNYTYMFQAHRVSEVEGIWYNSLARTNSTARSYHVGNLIQNYNLLVNMLEVSKRNGVSEDTALCAYNFFNQRTWNQIKVYGKHDAKTSLKLELQEERNLPRYKEFNVKMLRLSTLNKMGYRCTGRFLVKTIYFLKMCGAKRILAGYIFKMFIKQRK